MRWFSAYVPSYMDLICTPVSDRVLRQLYMEAVWGLINESECKAMMEASYVWPETLLLDGQRIILFTRSLQPIVQYVVAFRTVVPLCRQKITPAAFGAMCGRCSKYFEATVLKWLKGLQISETKLDYVMPLIRMRQERTHVEYKAAAMVLMKSLMAEILDGRAAADGLWLAAGYNGHVLKHNLKLFIRTNFAVYEECYREVVQTLASDSSIMMVD